MKIGIYCVRDNVNGFVQPTFDVYEANQVRQFTYAVNQPGMMNFKPEDFSLYVVGSYDSDTGIVESCEPRLIVHAVDVYRGE